MRLKEIENLLIKSTGKNRKLSKKQLEKCKEVARNIFKATEGMETERIKEMTLGEAQEII